MPPPGVLLASALGLAAAAVYVGLGAREARRAAGTSQRARAALAAFWLGLSLHVALDCAWALAAGAGIASPETSAVVLHLKILTGGGAFAGLVYHLLYLYTGRGFAPAVLALHVLAIGLVEYNYALRGSIGHEMSAFAARHAFERPATGFEDVAFLALFAPAIVASFAYALLARHVRGPARSRLLVKAVALLGFFVGLLAGFIIDTVWWEPVERAIVLATGLVAFAGGAGLPVAHAAQAPQAS